LDSRFRQGRFGAPVVCFVASLLVITAATPTPAHAATPPPGALGELGISVEPAAGVTPSPWLVHEVDPGGSVADDAIVANDSDTARSLDIYAADARTLPSGAFEADLKQVQPRGLAAWIRLDASHFDLAPHSRRRVHVGLQVPSSADVGEYEASILAQFETADNQQVHIVHRVGLRVYVTVKGSLAESGQIETVNGGHWWERGWPGDAAEIRTTFVNTSKVHLKLSGSVTTGGSDIPLIGGGGESIVLRDSRTTVATPLPSHPWIGMQRVEVKVNYSNRDNGHAVATADLWFVPWKGLLLMLAALVLLAYLGWRGRAWLRRSRTVAVSLRGVTMRMAFLDPHNQPDGLPRVPPADALVVITLRVVNGGAEQFHFSQGRLRLLDATNRAFTADPDITKALGEGGDRAVPPGGHEVLALAFLVPAGTKPRAGVYTANSGTIIVEMGPVRT
jgi:hypothetical protein